MKELVPEINIKNTVITPNDDGNQDYTTVSFTLTEDAKVFIYAVNAVEANIKNVFTSQDLQPGTYSFTWDGTSFYNSKVLDGNYYFKIGIANKNGDLGYLIYKNAVVSVNNNNPIKLPDDVQYAKVIVDTAQMGVNMNQPYTAQHNTIFPILDYREHGAPEFAYQVKVTDGILGLIDVHDVEVIPNKNIPKQWGSINADNVQLYNKPYDLDTDSNPLIKGTELQVLRKDKNWFRIKLSSGTQRYVKESELTLIEKSSVPRKALGIYTVTAGDSLCKISNYFGISTHEIINSNHIVNQNYIQVGQNLLIPLNLTSTEEPRLIYSIKPKDTLWKIANKYNMSIKQLAELNNIDPQSYLSINQTLYIIK